MLNFSFKGRAGRFEFFLVTISWVLLSLTAFGVVLFASFYYSANIGMGVLLGHYGLNSVVVGTIAPPLALVAINIFIFFNILAVSVRRCNDIGVSPFWSLAVFLVPIAGWLMVGCYESSRSHAAFRGSQDLEKDAHTKNQHVAATTNQYAISELDKNSFRNIQKGAVGFAGYIVIACILYGLLKINPMDDALRIFLYFIVSCVIAHFILNFLGD